MLYGLFKNTKKVITTVLIICTLFISYAFSQTTNTMLLGKWKNEKGIIEYEFLNNGLVIYNGFWGYMYTVKEDTIYIKIDQKNHILEI